MLTDLPGNLIAEINTTLAALGFNASILSEDRNDAISQIGKGLFRDARFIVDGLIGHMKLSTNVYVCIIHDEERDFQACAIKLGADEYCIAIWLGVALRSASMTSRLLSSKSGSSIFGLEVVAEKPKVVPFGQDTFQAFKELSFLPPLIFGERNDDFRRCLDFAAFEWLVLHEMGHIVNGHLIAGRNLNGLTYILEDNPSPDLDDNLTSQALEMDADCFATLYGIQNAIVRPLPIELQGSPACVLTEVRVKAFVFAIMTVIRGFDDAPFEVETMFASDHPPGGIRMSYLVAQIATLALEKKVDFSGVNVTNLTAGVVVAVELAINEATGIDGRGGNFIKAFQMGWEPFSVPILSRWAKLYDGLNEVKISPFKLAPPQYPPA